MTLHSDPITLAETIVADGFDAHDDALHDLLDRARSRGVKRLLLDIAGDRCAPAVVRERALGKIIVHLSRPAHRSSGIKPPMPTPIAA